MGALALGTRLPYSSNLPTARLERPSSALTVTSGKKSARAEARLRSAASTRQRLAGISARRHIQSIFTLSGKIAGKDGNGLGDKGRRSLVARPTSAAKAPTRTSAEHFRYATSS